MKKISLILSSAILFAASVCMASETLLIHDTLSKPFSMVNEIAPVQAALMGFETKVSTKTASQVDMSDLEKADFIILVGISGFPTSAEGVMKALQTTSKRVLAVGAAAGFASSTPVMSTPNRERLDKARITYRGHDWTLQIDPFYGRDCKGAHALIGTGGKKSLPLAWQLGNRFGFGALPSDRVLSMLFVDVLLDFYGIESTAPAGLVFVVQDFNPSCDPATLRRLADYFDHHRIPFLVSVQMSEVPYGVELCPRGEFLDAIRYAKAHGARILIHGLDGSGRIQAFTKEGILIEGGEGGGDSDQSFQIGSVSIQRIPGEPPVPWVSAVPLRIGKDRVCLTANVRSGVDGVAYEELKSSLREISTFRGAVAVVLVPAWMRFQDMMSAIEAARSLNLPNIDVTTRFIRPQS